MKSVIYRATYGLLGVGFLMGSLGTFLMMFDFFSDMAEQVYSPRGHLLQEFGCSLAFMGLMSLWYSFNLKKGRVVGLLLVLFFVLLALVHWIDFFKGNLPIASPLINSVPMLVLAALHSFRPAT